MIIAKTWLTREVSQKTTVSVNSDAWWILKLFYSSAQGCFDVGNDGGF
jgi:hypothetical protein